MRKDRNREPDTGSDPPKDRTGDKDAQAMTKAKDKVAGKVKQVVAEVTGDGKLREEGKEQEKKKDEEPGPIEGINKLT
jgi:uncharacterized protein YjbJ (UPF0337 family)